MIKKSTRAHKKYMIKYKDRWVHFGDNRYQQYRDSTPLKLYKHLDHNDPQRRKNYYQRHGKTAKIGTAKYYSHKYLW